MQVSVAVRLLVPILAGLVMSFQVAAGQAPETMKRDPARAARAVELLTQARDAVGGNALLQKVTGFSASVSVRRFIEYIAVTSPTTAVRREKTLKGRISLECQFPDKFRKRTSSSTLTGYKYSYVEVVSGERAWRDPPLQASSSGRDRHAIDVSDFERSLDYQAQGARQQLSLYALALLVRTVPEAAANYLSDGSTESNGRKVDIVTAYGLGDRYVRFLLDQETHLPVGFDSLYFGVRRYAVVVDAIVGRNSYPLFMEKVRRERAAQNRKPQKLRIQIRLSDHRRIAGILIPHRLTTTVDGKVVEELVINKLEINPRLNPRVFTPKQGDRVARQQ